MNITIFIATHKEAVLPNDSLYSPIHVGKAISTVSLPYSGDNTGEHISEKNKTFCELTAVYHAWKNSTDDYIGLCHYRRYFALKKPLFSKHKLDYVLNQSQAEELLQHTDIILPKKRNYYIETGYSHFIHAHPKESLEKTEEIIARLYPEYSEAFHSVLNRKKSHRFNMFIMKKELMNHYCQWLFTILFTLEQELDISGYSPYNQRIFGFIAERLLDVYIEKNNLSYKELPVIFTEKQHWFKKITSFLVRKFLSHKTC